MRLDRLLANLGYGSRREVKALIGAGRVEIAGATVHDESTQVRDVAAVVVDDEPLDHPGPLVVALHKPLGLVCSHDGREGPSVYDLMPARWMARNPRLESVGRLDRDTTGLVLLTDDHQLVHRMTSPRHHVAKRYVAVLDTDIRPGTEQVFLSGELVLDGESTPCLPAVAVERIEPHICALTIVEGRYHQVRRMFAALGAHVDALSRTHVGPVALDGLGIGASRVLAPGDIAALRA